MTGDQRRLLFGLFVVGWGTNVSTPLILVYQDRLKLSNSAAVAIFCVYVAGILLALLFAGRLSDRVGRRAVVFPATAMSAVGSLVLIAGQNSLAVLFIGRFLLGAVSGAMLSVASAWLNETADRTEVVPLRLASITTVVMYVGFGFGPVTSALWERFLDGVLVGPYVLHGIACAVALVLMWRVAETKPADTSVSLRPRLGVPVEARSEFLRTLAPAAVWVFGFPSVAFALLPVILRNSIDGADVLLSGAIGFLTSIAVLTSRPILQRVGDPRRAMPVALAMGVVGYVIGIVAFTTGAWWLAPIAAMLMGSASGVLMGAGLTISQEIADDSNRGELSATFYLVAYSGMAMPLIITGLGALTTTTIALVAITVIAAIALVVVAAGVRARA